VLKAGTSELSRYINTIGVIAGLDPAIHDPASTKKSLRKTSIRRASSWMPGSSPGMTAAGDARSE